MTGAAQERATVRRSAIPGACSTLVALGIGLDAVAAGILLEGSPLPAWREAGLVSVLHVVAVVLLSRTVRGRDRRGWLDAAAVLSIPLLGAALILACGSARGRAPRRRPRRAAERRPHALTPAEWRRLGSAPSLCDALDAADAGTRRAALSALSRREDPDAILILRRAAAGADPDLALSAAIVLDEIAARAERRVPEPAADEGRHAAG